MPSDSKKKRDQQKKAAAKQRQAQGGKKGATANGASANPTEDDFVDENEDEDTENETPSQTPTTTTNGHGDAHGGAATADVDPNVKSVIQNLDLLSMVERANAEARSCTGETIERRSLSALTVIHSFIQVFSPVIHAVAMFTSISSP